MPKPHQELIRILKAQDFKAICPSCDETIQLKKTTLFSPDEFPVEAKAMITEAKAAIRERKESLLLQSKNKKVRIENTTKSVNMGFILERLAPVLDHFPFDRNDCRSLFDPIDYVIFEGLHQQGKVNKILFVDIKSGGAKLKQSQKAIKQKIKEKKVSFSVYP
jgi:predicted Holliday junction resolvase-like endonuclease